MKINHLDLFSGIGGFHLGFERAGYEITSYFSEIDKHAIAVYKHQFPTSTYVGSVTNVRGADLPNINLITFGSPCQDFSLAGKRKGMEGQRSSLVLEAIRLISECRPSVFIWENVKGTFSSNDGADFWAIIKAFTDIGGYRLEWQLLNTSWFLPQNRERIYLVGYSTTTSGGGVFPIGKETGKPNKIKQTASLTGGQVGRVLDPQGIGYALSACDYKDPMKVEIKTGTNLGYEQALIGDSINLTFGTSTTRRGRVGKQKAQTLDTSCNQAVEENYRIRRLTPIECERLQGFPDQHTAFGNYDDIVKPMNKSKRYKQCGNAVSVDVVTAIAKKCLPLFK